VTLRERIINLRTVHKMGPRAIARHLGVGPGVVAGHLNRAGLTDHDSLHARARTAKHSMAFKRKVVDEPGNLREVAQKYGIHNATVHRWRKKMRKP
jgi:transposase